MKESKELQAINNQIECLLKKNEELNDVFCKNSDEIDNLHEKARKLKEASLIEWYDTHPFAGCYKKECYKGIFHTITYIYVDDEKVEQYYRNTKAIIEHEYFLHAKQVELDYDTQSKRLVRVEYSTNHCFHVENLSPTCVWYEGQPKWQAISENEYLNAKDIAIDFMKNN